MIKSIPQLISKLSWITSFKVLQEEFSDNNKENNHLYISYISSWKARTWFVFPAQYTLAINGVQLMFPKDLTDLKIPNEFENINEDIKKKFKMMQNEKDLKKFIDFWSQNEIIKYLTLYFKLNWFKNSLKINDKTSIKEIEKMLENPENNKIEIFAELDSLPVNKLKELLFSSNNVNIVNKLLKKFEESKNIFSNADSKEALELFKRFGWQEFVANFFKNNLCWLNLKELETLKEFKDDIVKKSIKSYDVFITTFHNRILILDYNKNPDVFSNEDYLYFFNKFKNYKWTISHNAQYLKYLFWIIKFDNDKNLEENYNYIPNDIKEKESIYSKIICNENIKNKSILLDCLKNDINSITYYLKRKEVDLEIASDVLFNIKKYTNDSYNIKRIKALILESWKYNFNSNKIQEIFNYSKNVTDKFDLEILYFILKNNKFPITKDLLLELYELIIQNRKNYSEYDLENLTKIVKERKQELKKD